MGKRPPKRRLRKFLGVCEVISENGNMRLMRGKILNRWLTVCFIFISVSSAFSETFEKPLNLELTGTFSVMNPNRLILSSREYKVSYSKNFFGVSAFQLGFGVPTRALGSFEVSPFARFGYARNQGTYSLTAQDGSLTEAPVTLHWVPISAGVRTEYNIPGFVFIRPFFLLSAGAEWLTQRGDLAGVSENFWVPYYNLGLGLSFADSSLRRESVFGGFSFSMNLQNSLRDDQEAQCLSYDLTVHFFL